MVTQIDGRDVTVNAGRLVRPEQWGWAMPLAACEWDGAAFRLPSANFPDVRLAVNVTVTGRTIQKGFVRVQIEFVGDGEPSTFCGGWMQVG